jgi:hypothetical protein
MYRITSLIFVFFVCALFPATSFAAGSASHTFKNADYDRVWQACIDVREKYGFLKKGTATADGKVIFEIKADKDKGIIAFVTAEAIIARTYNTIRLQRFGKTTVKVSITSIKHNMVVPWSDKRDKETEKKLLEEIRAKIE